MIYSVTAILQQDFDPSPTAESRLLIPTVISRPLVSRTALYRRSHHQHLPPCPLMFSILTSTHPFIVTGRLLR